MSTIAAPHRPDMAANASRLRPLAILVVVGLAVAMFVYWLGHPAALPDDAGSTVSGVEADVGELVHYGVFPSVTRPVEVRDVSVVGLPDGLELVEVNLAEATVTNAGTAAEGGTALGTTRGPLFDGESAQYARRSVVGATLNQGPAHTYFIITVRATRPGTFKTDGVELHYRDGIRRGSGIYRQALEVVAS